MNKLVISGVVTVLVAVTIFGAASYQQQQKNDLLIYCGNEIVAIYDAGIRGDESTRSYMSDTCKQLQDDLRKDRS